MALETVPLIRGYIMNDIAKRLTIEEIYKMKLDYLASCKEMHEALERSDNIMHRINSYTNYRIDNTTREIRDDVKYFDKEAWKYLCKTYQVEKYMLCTEYEKLQNDISYGRVPEFTIENVRGWIAGLNQTVCDNVKKMLYNVYDKITNGYYYVGKEKKKRNNTGIDKNFIITTYDYSCMYNYWTGGPTLTDDLEKVCYILDGKSVPDITIKNVMKGNNACEGKNDYFEIKICLNGNTHYKLTDETWLRLNKIAGNRAMIGQNIKIKVFN